MKFLLRLFSLLDTLLLVLLCLLLIFIFKVRITIPEVDLSLSPSSYSRVQVAENHYKLGSNWLRKNKSGIWEMYLEGSPYERGLIYGVLAKELIVSQEKAFVKQIDELVPSRIFQHFLRIFITWFNRDMNEFVDPENLEEIYGISQSFADEYDYILPKFYRILYYHAAHDIGHALSDLRIVGCTSFSANNQYTTDRQLLLGRNFDFYMGEDFARDKLLLFVKPDTGYAFATYSWAGFTGVVSGMNEEGLTVTLNASKSDIPISAKTPISLLAREILQYARNIEEAIEIARNKEIFVSESLLIGSSQDSTSVIIEKGPAKMDVFPSQEDLLLCSNHFQSEVFEQDESNVKNIEQSDSKSRFLRLQQLIDNNKPLDYLKTAEILRDRKGLNAKELGLGNASAVNPLIAHHAIIFKPYTRQLWVSSSSYQLGSFVQYNLNEVFHNTSDYFIGDSLEIGPDPFLLTAEYAQYKQYRVLKEKIVKNLLFHKDFTLSNNEINQFIASNPESYEVYSNLGKYYTIKGFNEKAKKMYITALNKQIASNAERNQIRADYQDLLE